MCTVAVELVTVLPSFLGGGLWGILIGCLFCSVLGVVGLLPPQNKQGFQVVFRRFRCQLGRLV